MISPPKNKFEKNKRDALWLINKYVDKKVDSIFGSEVNVKTINVEGELSNDDFFSIAINQQLKIITDSELRWDIFSKVDDKNLKLWNNILETTIKKFEEISKPRGNTLPFFYFAMKSVVTPKLMDFDSLLKLLDDNFGDNLFPSFSYEDAAVILFIKPIYPHWIFQLFSNYQKDLSRYINYLAFAMKIVIEKIKEINIDICIKKRGIKTYSAAQNILINLNNFHYKAD